MCGFIGIVATAPVADRPALVRGREAMHARGPDGSGQWWSADGCVGFGHRRLAIIDLDDRAAQPMVSADARYVIAFNGEIYNYRALREELIAAGVSMRTSSDTEVVLALYARDGARMLPKLRGMFAFAIWDTHARELFLARDPYGIKPLYYARVGEALMFASQVKALLATGFTSTEHEPAGLAGFYLWGSVPEPWSLYRDIHALPAGHSWHIRPGERSEPQCWEDIRRYWRDAAPAAPAEALAGRVREAVRESVRAHLVADVPVAVFLSGGIDSGAVAGLAQELGAAIEGVTIGFEEFAGRHDNEIPVAAAIARHYGMSHHVRMVSSAEFEQDVPRILAAMDQPSIDGVNTWFAAKAAAERGYKAVLSGVGGDELFYGYASFRDVPRSAAWGRVIARTPGATTLLRAALMPLARMRRQPKLAGVPELLGTLEGNYFLRRSLFLPAELPAIIGTECARIGLARLGGVPPGMTDAVARDGAAAVGQLESIHYLRNQLLRDSDWASMAHSLELRTPLVDARLLAALGPLSAGFAPGRGKSMLAHAPTHPLPHSIIARPKTGFSLPMAAWLSRIADRWSIAAPQVEIGTTWARRWGHQVVSQALANG